MINCDIYLHSTSEHVSQLCTGFSLLAKQKKIRLSYKFGPFEKLGKRPLARLNPYELQGMFVVVEGEKAIFYDVSDGDRLILEALEVADIYYKRSYRPESIPGPYKNVVFPLGLNYEVYLDNFDKLDVSRFINNPKNYASPRQLVKSLLRNTGLRYSPSLGQMYCPPNPAQSPKVLFMARTWNPDYYPGGFPADSPENWKEICTEINETRFKIIKALTKELGPLFYGGFGPEEYALGKYPKYVLKEAKDSTKKEYIRRLKEYPICIASNGLYNSIGWKFGEYVAFSKAIVSEKLHYSVPGNFLPDKNYLDFETVDQCVNQTIKLVEDKGKRGQLMENNHLYYHSALSPDQLIWRTIAS